MLSIKERFDLWVVWVVRVKGGCQSCVGCVGCVGYQCCVRGVRVVRVDKHERRVSTGYPNTEKKVENKKRGRVFLTKFEVFGWPMKHCLECLIYLLNQAKTSE